MLKQQQLKVWVIVNQFHCLWAPRAESGRLFGGHLNKHASISWTSPKSFKQLNFIGQLDLSLYENSPAAIKCSDESEQVVCAGSDCLYARNSLSWKQIRWLFINRMHRPQINTLSPQILCYERNTQATICK